jgi:hypothetical protein
MNLQQANGKVPIPSCDFDRPILLIPFPTREQFNSLYGKRTDIDKKWIVLTARAQGCTLLAAGASYGLSRERVRQIEEKFIRLMSEYWQRKPS